MLTTALDLKHWFCLKKCLNQTTTHMIDLLARARKFEESEEMIRPVSFDLDSIPFDLDSIGWAALLGACRNHRNLKLGARAAEELIRLEPSNAAAYAMLSNMYATKERWDEVEKMCCNSINFLRTKLARR
nr:pentatricopeptide repeat protein AaPPR1516 [Agave angustifolia]